MAKNKFAKGDIPWYRLGPVLSHNAVINIILGPRGDGKTFAAKEQGIRNWVRRSEQFVYLRRYRNELSVRSTFFDDIRDKFPDHDFKVDGMEGKIKEKNANQWHTLVFFEALSTSQQKKSKPYPEVTLIIFDEFIIDRGVVHYLPQEVKMLLDFYSTVDRYQDRTRILMISNTVSIANQYFMAWNIKPQPGQEWFKDPTGFLVVHFIQDNAFQREVLETRFGKFIEGSDYADYSVGAQFADNHDLLVKAKTSEACYMFTLETETGMFALWQDPKTQIFYVTERRPRNDEVVLTMLANQMSENKKYVLRTDKFLGRVRTAFGHGRLFFENAQARNAFVGFVVK